MTFGAFLRDMRENKKLRQADLAAKIGVTPVYVCDIEKGRRYPPDLDKLNLWASQLELTSVEYAKFFDLAGLARDSTPPDIAKYLEAHPSARDAIRRIIGQRIDYNWDRVPK